jgi:hypothetical protein
MKNKIAVALGFLFALAPLAAPKGRAQVVSFSASCDAADSCIVTGSGLAANTSYILNVADSCGAPVRSTALNTDSSGMLNAVFGVVYESFACDATGWTFTLSTSGRKSAVVATYFAADGD